MLIFLCKSLSLDFRMENLNFWNFFVFFLHIYGCLLFYNELLSTAYYQGSGIRKQARKSSFCNKIADRRDTISEQCFL